MRQSFDRTVDERLISEIRMYGTSVGRGIKVKQLNECGGLFGMIIPGLSVPGEWAQVAFSFGARRHDRGAGDSAHMVWLIPMSGVPALRTMMPALTNHVSGHATAAVIQKVPVNQWGSSLVVV